MRKIYLLLIALAVTQIKAQTVYNSVNYAINGQTFYHTAASELTLDYETTGTNHVWNFATLTGTSQVKTTFRLASSTGFLWPFIFNTFNTNLSSTTDQTATLNLPGQVVGLTNANNYYKQSTADVRQVASAYKVNYNGLTIPITNEYTNSDILYRFPIQYGNTDSDDSAYTIDIPTLMHQENTLQRTNEVDGWGSIVTPYNTYPNVLRMKTTLVSNDTISYLGIGLPRTIRTTREFKWLSPLNGQPVMIVTQNQAAGNWVTTNVTYLDSPRTFQTTALFTYAPINPAAGEEVYFQNLSTNATTFSWNFGDPASGTDNTSSEEYPTHTFAADGVYEVQLIASNATFTDTYTFTVVIGNLAVAQNSLETASAVYPNPFSARFQLSTKLEAAHYVLTNMSGQQVYNGTHIEEQDFSDLAAGAYVLTVWNREEVKKYKLLKQ